MMEVLNLDTVVNWLGLFGIAVFAISGALDAARKEMDVLGFILIGTVTGLGGGTLRDLLLGVAPVYWVRDSLYVGVCMAAAVLTYFLVPYVVSRTRALVWMDALGLSLFCVTGTQIALSYEVPALIAVCMGVMTASFGGIIRDVLCQVSLVLGGRELYVTAAVAGASSYLLLNLLQVPDKYALIGGFLICLSLRGAAILFGLTLPYYHRREG